MDDLTESHASIRRASGNWLLDEATVRKSLSAPGKTDTENEKKTRFNRITH